MHAGTTICTNLIRFLHGGWYMNGGKPKLSELPGAYKMQNFSLVFQIFFRLSGDIIN